MVWSQLKLVFFKFKIRMIKIFVLKKGYEIGRKVKLKLDKIGKNFTLPIS